MLSAHVPLPVGEENLYLLIPQSRPSPQTAILELSLVSPFSAIRLEPALHCSELILRNPPLATSSENVAVRVVPFP